MSPETFSRNNALAALADFFSDPDQQQMALSGSHAVHRLERRMADLVGLPFALALANATSTLWTAFKAAGLAGCEVVTTPYSWGSIVAGLAERGCKPVFADVDPQTLTLDPAACAKAITPTTAAILAVDVYGTPCDMAALRRIADEYDLLLIQDCANSLGARLAGRHTGAMADIAVFSFGYGKLPFAGEGGMLLTRDESTYQNACYETQHPMRSRRDCPGLPDNEMAMNMRLNPLSAIVADAFLGSAVREIWQRSEQCRTVLEDLFRWDAIKRPVFPAAVEPSFQTLVVEPVGLDRLEEALAACRADYDITPAPVQQPIYAQQPFQSLSRSKGWEIPSCAIAEAACRNRVALVPQRENAASRRQNGQPRYAPQWSAA